MQLLEYPAAQRLATLSQLIKQIANSKIRPNHHRSQYQWQKKIKTTNTIL